MLGLDTDATYDEVEQKFDELKLKYASDTKLKIKLGYPVYCPFQIRDGGVYNLPFVRLDDILAQEAATEFKHNAQRRAANDAQRQQALNLG